MDDIDRLFQEFWSGQIPYVFLPKSIDQARSLPWAISPENVPRIASLSLGLGAVYMGVFVIEACDSYQLRLCILIGLG